LLAIPAGLEPATRGVEIIRLGAQLSFHRKALPDADPSVRGFLRGLLCARAPVPAFGRLGDCRRRGTEREAFVAHDEFRIEVAVDPKIRAAAERARTQLPVGNGVLVRYFRSGPVSDRPGHDGRFLGLL